jgi:hypothetical protein
MWSCITILYLLPAAILTIQLLTGRISHVEEAPHSELQGVEVPQRDPKGLEAV